MAERQVNERTPAAAPAPTASIVHTENTTTAMLSSASRNPPIAPGKSP
jgi:hypothetical protein